MKRERELPLFGFLSKSSSYISIKGKVTVKRNILLNLKKILAFLFLFPTNKKRKQHFFSFVAVSVFNFLKEQKNQTLFFMSFVLFVLIKTQNLSPCSFRSSPFKKNNKKILDPASVFCLLFFSTIPRIYQYIYNFSS